ncbi:MAG: Flp pilus assembly complex ATPase component TadA, partial [Candidatus Omnitrophica bacterium]|nr:Flp pilus assembly complex ATPase component TadA [Candidatus Omnitrophota bacterium]
LSIAETGHLVLATLHTSDAIQTVNRVIDVFSDYKQQQIRTTLSFVLNAVLSQRLIPGIDGGRYMASEIMIATSGVRSIIRKEKMHQVYSLIQTGRSLGMQTMNQSLAELYLSGKISIEQAMMYSSDVQELKDLTSKGAKP